MTTRSLTIEVFGRPAQMGSKRAFVRGSRAIMVNDNSDRLRQWYNAVASRAAETMGSAPQFLGPIRLSVEFRFKRPRGHYGSGRNAAMKKPGSPIMHTQKPDLDKLVRSTQDALSAVVWRDDCQVCEYGVVRRVWAEDGREGATIVVEELTSNTNSGDD